MAREKYLMYHGTSSKQLDRLIASRWKAKNFYVGDELENIAAHYAESQSEKDDSEPVILVLDEAKLKKHGTMEQDVHGEGSAIEDEDAVQVGQYIFNGDLKPALVSVMVNWKPISKSKLAALLKL